MHALVIKNMNTEQLQNTLAAFDLENAKDPHTEEWNGKTYPKELLYGQRMSECLLEYTSEASETIQLAARCQHIRRWEIPRESYSQDRKGYLIWRNDLKEMHASIAGKIMAERGYGENAIQQVQKLLKKKGLKSDPEVQILEDVICIVFLKYYFESFAPKHDDEKIRSILLKTLNKMSESGIEYAKSLPNSRFFLKYLS